MRRLKCPAGFFQLAINQGNSRGKRAVRCRIISHNSRVLILIFQIHKLRRRQSDALNRGSGGRQLNRQRIATRRINGTNRQLLSRIVGDRQFTCRLVRCRHPGIVRLGRDHLWWIDRRFHCLLPVRDSRFVLFGRKEFWTNDGVPENQEQQ